MQFLPKNKKFDTMYIGIVNISHIFAQSE